MVPAKMVLRGGGGGEDRLEPRGEDSLEIATSQHIGTFDWEALEEQFQEIDDPRQADDLLSLGSAEEIWRMPCGGSILQHIPGPSSSSSGASSPAEPSLAESSASSRDELCSLVSDSSGASSRDEPRRTVAYSSSSSDAGEAESEEDFPWAKALGAILEVQQWWLLTEQMARAEQEVEANEQQMRELERQEQEVPGRKVVLRGGGGGGDDSQEAEERQQQTRELQEEQKEVEEPAPKRATTGSFLGPQRSSVQRALQQTPQSASSSSCLEATDEAGDEEPSQLPGDFGYFGMKIPWAALMKYGSPAGYYRANEVPDDWDPELEVEEPPLKKQKRFGGGPLQDMPIEIVEEIMQDIQAVQPRAPLQGKDTPSKNPLLMDERRTPVKEPQKFGQQLDLRSLFNGVKAKSTTSSSTYRSPAAKRPRQMSPETQRELKEAEDRHAAERERKMEEMRQEHEVTKALLKAQRLGVAPRKFAYKRGGYRGVKGGAGSNRRDYGEAPLRRELTAPVKLAMATFMKSKKDEFQDEALFWRAMVMKYTISKQALLHIMRHEASWRKTCEKKNLGKRTRGGKGRHGSYEADVLREAAGVGCRAPGGGRKDLYGHLKARVKDWFLLERSHGHRIDREDLFDEFCTQLELEIKTFEAKMELEAVPADKVWLYSMQERLRRLTESQKYKETYKAELQRKVGAKLLLPQRVTQLTAIEEKVRAELTWQCFDSVLYLAAFGDEQELRKHVAAPREFIENREDTVLGFSDQIPFWVGLPTEKQLYSKGELQQKASSASHNSQEAMPKPVGGNQPRPACIEAHVPVDDNEGQTQQRGTGDHKGDRLRITLEVSQVIYNYFSSSRPPVGALGPTMVVFPGTHGRLSNIDVETGLYIKTERFEYANKVIVHEAGKAAGAHMRTWVKMKREHPELFKHIRIYQQPAGYVDTIIFTWRQEELMELFPQSVWQRDLFAAALTDTSRKSMCYSQSIPCWVASQMTAVLQITDTDIAFLLKRFAAKTKQLVISWLKLKAKEDGTRMRYRIGHWEMLRIIHGALVQLEEYEAKHQTVLKAARGNYLCSYRPNLEKGCFERSDSQPWAKDLPEGTHRIKSSWAADRYNWLDEKGKPVQPEWSRTAGIYFAHTHIYIYIHIQNYIYTYTHAYI